MNKIQVTNVQVTNEERSMMRAALLQAGIKTRGLDDDQLTSHYLDKFSDTPKKAEKINGDKPAPETEVKPEVKDTPFSEPIIKPAPDANNIGQAIQDAINAGLSGVKGSLDTEAVIKLINQHSKAPQLVEHIIRVVPAKGKPIKIEKAHPMLSDVLDWFSLDENVYLVGGAGTGKTTLAEQAAKALKMDFYAHGAIFESFQLFGFVDANGKYHNTPFYNACKGGGVCLFDELDSGYPAPLNSINQAIENGYVVFPNGETIIIDRNKTKFIGAANTIGLGATRQFVGRNPLDGAFLDRFKQVDIDYDLAIELSMSRAAWLKGGGDEKDFSIAENWARTVIDFRATLEKRGIKAIVSTRATRGGAGVLAKGWPLDKVKHCELYKHLSADQKKQLGVS